MRRVAAVLAAGLLCAGARAGEWTFASARLAADAAAGRATADGALELDLPGRRACGWWTCVRKVDAGPGAVRFRATAEIALAAGERGVFNDFTMVVTFNHPADGVKRKGAFFKRDFVAYTDTAAADGGRVTRRFDETYALPDGCDAVKIEFIGKWHAMTVRVRDVRAESVARPPARKVRCVVGNPHERFCADWSDPLAVRAARLAQIEATLTNIFARVEKPDIILFSELFADTGSKCPEITAERIPGGPSFELARKYAARHRCHIAMNVRERTDAGTYHNSVFIVDRAGRLAGVYRKTHLTSGEYQAGFLPGDGLPVFELDFGRVGCLVCWDNWFSETAKLLKRNGAELLLFPLAGCAWDHVDITFPARAIDTGVPMLVAMRQGHLPNGILHRDGTWAAQTYEDGGFAWADIDLAERRPTFWLSVGAGQGDPYQLYYDESRPEMYLELDSFTRPRR